MDSENRYQGQRSFNRKRRFRDQDDDDFDRRRPQRRRYEEPDHVKLQKRILALATSSRMKVEDDIADICRMLNEHQGEQITKEAFTNLVLQTTINQPIKIPFIAALMHIANLESPDLIGEVLRAVTERLSGDLSKGSWGEVKLWLRLLACVQNMLENDGVYPILEELFSRAVDLQTTSSEDGLGLELVKIILLTIAYAMACSDAPPLERTMALLEKTDIVASTPHGLEPLVSPFQEQTPGGSISLLSKLQQQLQAEAANGWKLECIPRPWKSIQLPQPLDSAQKHTLQEVVVPEKATSKSKPRMPELYLSVFQDQEVETVPTDNIAAIVLRDALVDTINGLDFNRNIASRCLIDLDCYFPVGTFAKRATPFDAIRDIEEGQSRWKPEDVAIDAVFSQLLQLPAPEHKLVYYHSLLTEACKIAPAAIAPSLGRAIRFLYRNISRMDVELCHRFMDWFSHHLSNFGFTWKWTEWSDDITLDSVNPKKAFILGAVDKEIRLSFVQRIKGTLPESYHSLLPEDEQKEIPDFKFENDDQPLANEARELSRLMKARAADSEIQAQMTAIRESAATRGLSDPLVKATDAFVTTLCFVGAISLSHLLNLIERNKEQLLAIGQESEPARRQIVGSVLEYWAERPGVGISIIDKLLNYTILTPKSVVEWVFVDMHGGEILSKPHVYEMVAMTVFKVTNRVRQIVIARTQPSLPESQVKMVDETLASERAQSQELFGIIDGNLARMTNGEGAPGAANGESSEEVALIVRGWASRWLKTFQRKLKVEELWIEESLAAAPEAQKEAAADEGPSNGTDEVNMEQ